MAKVSRRSFLKVGGAAAALTATARGAVAGETPASAQHDSHGQQAARKPAARKTPYLFFNAQEAAFIEAAVARLIPADDLGPGALEAGVAQFIDGQLGGAWGAGERLYRSGPWQTGKPTQGYQLPFTPAELFRNALRAIRADLTRNQRDFGKLSAAEQDDYLKALQAGKVDLGNIPSAVFFESLLEMTMEGFFSDPVYGGNRDMVGWKLIGFPGAYSNYYNLVDQHNLRYTRVPMSLAETAEGHVEIKRNIPASVRGKGR